MALVNFTDLDFDQIKSSIREYLRSNSNFTDYDFEGSNLSVLIDVLAYNTYISSYNANMVSNEVFIDSATLRENVVSLAKNIGYVPRSRTASRSNISFFVNTSILTSSPKTVTLREGLVCTSSTNFQGESYTFVVPNDVTVPVVNNIASFDNLEVYEGTYLKNTFTYNSNNPNQRFILDNPNIDTSLIKVEVRNDVRSSAKVKYRLANSLFDIDETSKVFFLHEIEDQRYELFFGDGIFGKKLEDGNYIEVSYVICNGESANNINQFTFNGNLIDNSQRIITTGISLITAETPSRSGQEIESVASIRKYSPRIYASQNRAVTATDYETIIRSIYPETDSVSVYGGEDLNPPKFGRVFISIKPINGEFVPNAIKNNLKTLLRKYSVAGIVPEIIDLNYLYLEVDSNIYYNTNLAKSSNYVKSIVFDNIVKYTNSIELNKYGSRFKYSKFLKIIDDSHESITSNITKIIMRRDLSVEINKFAQYEICYGNEFHIKDNCEGFNIKSSGFNIAGSSETYYLSDMPDKKNNMMGSIFAFTLSNIKNKRTIGTIDYKKGEIKLNTINITSTSKTKRDQSIIEISVIPKSNDVIGLQDLYLQLDINNSSFNMITDEIESGSDISGSNYIVSSSYTNGDLVRL